ncbi:MAG: hypothetical protein OXC08_11190 [Thiotrichales bacterium]|nr:hypothetical protein [Thiotrichales bacterium]
MPEYMVNYDLRTNDYDDRSGDYGEIEAVLSNMGAVEVLISQWVLTSETASAKRLSTASAKRLSKELRRKFGHSFREDDSLLVCAVEPWSDRTWFGTSIMHDL